MLTQYINIEWKINMNGNTDAVHKLNIVKDYSYRELEFLIQFLENGLLCDLLGQPYTHERLKDLAFRYDHPDEYRSTGTETANGNKNFIRLINMNPNISPEFKLKWISEIIGGNNERR